MKQEIHRVGGTMDDTELVGDLKCDTEDFIKTDKAMDDN